MNRLIHSWGGLSPLLLLGIVTIVAVNGAPTASGAEADNSCPESCNVERLIKPHVDTATKCLHEKAALDKAYADVQGISTKCVQGKESLTKEYELAQTQLAKCKVQNDAFEETVKSNNVALEDAKKVATNFKALEDSRRDLAAELEKSKSNVARLTNAKTELESRVERLEKSNAGLVTGQQEKNKAQEKIIVMAGSIDQLEAKIKVCEADLTKCSNLGAECTAECGLVTRKKLMQTGESFWILTKSVSEFFISGLYNGVTSNDKFRVLVQGCQNFKDSAMSHKMILQARSFYEKEILAPGVALWRKAKVQFNDKVVPSSRQAEVLFKERVLPLLKRVNKEFQAMWNVFSVRSASYIQSVNTTLDLRFIGPLTDKFPAVKSLLPASAGDRICLFCVSIFFLRQVWLKALCALKLLHLLLRLPLPSTFCGRKQKTEKSAGKQKSDARSKKSFQPAPNMTKHTHSPVEGGRGKLPHKAHSGDSTGKKSK